MIARVKDLDKAAKILLLRAIADGTVDKDLIDDNTLVATEYNDAFLFLMMTCSAGENETERTSIVIGEARRGMEDLLKLSKDHD
jgi:hypothetical protein